MEILEGLLVLALLETLYRSVANRRSRPPIEVKEVCEHNFSSWQDLSFDSTTCYMECTKCGVLKMGYCGKPTGEFKRKLIHKEKVRNVHTGEWRTVNCLELVDV